MTTPTGWTTRAGTSSSTGTGPNEGLTAILFSLGVWEQFPNEYGVIYRGDPPPASEELLTAE